MQISEGEHSVFSITLSDGLMDEYVDFDLPVVEDQPTDEEFMKEAKDANIGVEFILLSHGWFLLLPNSPDFLMLFCGHLCIKLEQNSFSICKLMSYAKVNTSGDAGKNEDQRQKIHFLSRKLQGVSKRSL